MKINICCKGMANLLSNYGGSSGMIFGIFYCPYCGEKIDFIDEEKPNKDKITIGDDLNRTLSGDNPLARDSVGGEEMGE